MPSTPQTIALIQTSLNGLGTIEEPPLKLDGVHGPLTNRAIELWQLEADLVPDGAINDALLDSFCEGLCLDLVGDPDWGAYFKHLYGADAMLTTAQTAPGHPGTFLPIGILVGHTAGPKERKHVNVVELRDGDKEKPGPRIHFAVSRDGGVDQITNGRATHAKPGDAKALSRILRGEAPRKSPEDDSSIGDPFFYGVTVDYFGDEPRFDGQAQSLVLVLAMWCYAWGWDPEVRILGGKEWTLTRVDPGFTDMTVLREQVAEVVDGFDAQADTEAGSLRCPHCDGHLLLIPVAD